VNAFVFIGLDLSLRDRLHDAWAGRGLAWRMAGLIGAGSLLSWLLNPATGRIALASCAAFGLAAAADSAVYHFLGGRSFLSRSNGSNVAGAAVDSVVFPYAAFGGFLPLVVLGQFAAKTLGGFVWSLVIGWKGKGWE